MPHFDDLSELARRALSWQAQGVHQDPAVCEALNAAMGAKPKSASRFPNQRCEHDGINFDSLAERDRYLELRTLERAREIAALRPCPEYPKKERFTLQGGVAYIPDFTYYERGKKVAEDVKGAARKRGQRGTRTPIFELKAKQFREAYPDIELRIVER